MRTVEEVEKVVTMHLMRNTVLAMLSLAFVIAGHPRLAHAVGDIFTVNGVPVDASGETTSQARDIALDQGRTKAIRALFERLVPQSYWDMLPQKSGADILYLERGFQVSNEKSSSTRYLADVTYSFVPEKIRAELQAANIPFAEVQARSAVVVPLLIRGGRAMLWEEENFWRLSWRSKNFINELVPLIPALGEVEDITAVTADIAQAANWAALSPLADIYGTADVVVAKATLEEGTGEQVLQVDMQRVSGSGDSGTTSIRLRNTNALPLDQLADLAIDQAVARMQTNWKSQTIVNPNAPAQTIAATIRFHGLKEWLSIRSRLESLNTIKNLDIRAISRNGAEVKFAYTGTDDQLRVALAQRELNLLLGTGLNVIELASSMTNGAEAGTLGDTATPNAAPETGSEIDPSPVIQ